jgi:hypothetical protein
MLETQSISISHSNPSSSLFCAEVTIFGTHYMAILKTYTDLATISTTLIPPPQKNPDVY